MARYSRVGPGAQIFLLLLGIIGLLSGGLLWFDVLGLVDVRDTFAPVLGLVGIEERSGVENADDIMLIDRMRLQALQDATELRAAELDGVVLVIDQQQTELEQRALDLQQAEEELAEREESLNRRLQEFENRRAVLVQNSRDLTSMRPEDAVAILEGYDDQLLIETLRVTEELAQQAGEISFVPLWLSQLPPERAAEIQRKMTLRPAN